MVDLVMAPNEVGLMLALAREQAGFTQQQIADGLQVQRTMVSYWETGYRSIDPRYPAFLARYIPAMAVVAKAMGFEGRPPSVESEMMIADFARQLKKTGDGVGTR